MQRASVAYPVETSFGEASRVELREDRLVLTGEVGLPVGEQWWLVASVGSLWYLLPRLAGSGGGTGGRYVSGDTS